MLVLRDLSQPDIKDIFRDAHQSMDSGAGNLGLRSLSDRDDNTLSIYIYMVSDIIAYHQYHQQKYGELG